MHSPSIASLVSFLTNMSYQDVSPSFHSLTTWYRWRPIHCRPPLRVLRGVFRVHLEAMVVQPRLEVRVRQEAFLVPDAVHDRPKLGVALWHAQVLVLLVVRLELRPHLLLQVRHGCVVDEAALVQPRLEVRVPQEVFLGPDAVHGRPKLGVSLWHAQVLVLLVVRLELRPHLHQLLSRARLETFPHLTCIALSPGSEVEGLMYRFARLAVAHHAAVLRDERDLPLVRPFHCLHARQTLGLHHANREGTHAKHLDGPVQPKFFGLALCVADVLSLTEVEHLLARQAWAHDLSNVGCAEERVLGVDAIQGPFVDDGVGALLDARSLWWR